MLLTPAAAGPPVPATTFASRGRPRKGLTADREERLYETDILPGANADQFRTRDGRDNTEQASLSVPPAFQAGDAATSARGFRVTLRPNLSAYRA